MTNPPILQIEQQVVPEGDNEAIPPQVQEKPTQLKLYESIKPRPDLKDYYGNLPLFYALQRNDVPLVKKLFKPHKEYFTLTNYKN